MEFCQMKDVAHCEACSGDLRFGGYFCSEQSCPGFVGNLKSRIYRNLQDAFKDFESKYNDELSTVHEDDDTVRNIHIVWGAISTLPGSVSSYSGLEMQEIANHLVSEHLIDYDSFLRIGERIRQYRYNISKSLFHTFCTREKLCTSKKFNEIVEFERNETKTSGVEVAERCYKSFFNIKDI